MLLSRDWRRTKFAQYRDRANAGAPQHLQRIYKVIESASMRIRNLELA